MVDDRLTREAFGMLHDILKPPGHPSLPKSKGGKWSLSSVGQLGLFLFYIGSTMNYLFLCVIFGVTPNPCSYMLRNMLKLVVRQLRYHPIARIQYPSPEKMEMFVSMVNSREASIDDVIDFIDKCREEFKKMPPEDIAFPRTASDVRKYQSHSSIYAQKTPIHIRGALLFNHYIKEKKLTNKYSLILNGEKIKFVYLKLPNIIQENVISFIQYFPKELGLDKYIDYDLQFEKSFIDPLKSILDSMGWNIEKSVNLETFFN